MYGTKLTDMDRIITEELTNTFRQALYEGEKRNSTIKKYMRDIEKLKEFLGGRELSKELLIKYKEELERCGEYKVSSINSFLAAANHFCEVMGWGGLKIKMIKVQRDTFCPENKELTQDEYKCLIDTAMDRGDERLALIMQTLGSTGIRISELRYITVESLKSGMADIYNKGKMRKILYPSDLQKVLKEFAVKMKIKCGPIFRTGSGRAVDRSNVWKAMKKLCGQAGVDEQKVYPHNLRHLFAKGFYKIKKDIAKLADVLGHSSIETTRIYIKTTGKEHKRQLDMMKLVVVKSLRGRKPLLI